MMADCDRVLEVEEMVLRRGSHAELRRHLAGCEACQEAESIFREELALFAARRAPPRRRRFLQPRRWAALAIAAGLAIVGSALRPAAPAAPAALACVMPAEREALCSMPRHEALLSSAP